MELVRVKPSLQTTISLQSYNVTYMVIVKSLSIRPQQKSWTLIGEHVDMICQEDGMS